MGDFNTFKIYLTKRAFSMVGFLEILFVLLVIPDMTVKYNISESYLVVLYIYFAIKNLFFIIAWKDKDKIEKQLEMR